MSVTAIVNLRRVPIVPMHRRRINIEEKAKFVAAVWRTELIQFLAALQI